ncbi:Oidioi.mRNA.OKI2018_I69.chr2.g7683.t1.cds [Oikopleura dioica]|uniref:Oidioi.mRNA.OKI2018_I69.chr2.g7683.t1.cds n=1 Tax=Oikopleura dioica TaxID=34765 RepID=A0ABN7TDE2_OIKDI|nr:Oidioi.mRNA.OKI2018_I69.chr2.g7683.t1.cds [Oikopleura dioica]
MNSIDENGETEIKIEENTEERDEIIGNPLPEETINVKEEKKYKSRLGQQSFTVSEQLTYILEREKQMATLNPPTWRESGELIGASTSCVKGIFAKKELVKEYAALGLGFKRVLTKSDLEKYKCLRATLSDEEYNNLLIKQQKRQRCKKAQALRRVERKLKEKNEELPAKSRKLLTNWEETRGREAWLNKKWKCEISLEEFPTMPSNIDVTVKTDIRQLTVDGLSIKFGITESGVKFRSETRWRKKFAIPEDVDIDQGPTIEKERGKSNNLTVWYYRKQIGEEDDMMTLENAPKNIETQPQIKQHLTTKDKCLKKNSTNSNTNSENLPEINVPEFSSSEDESMIEEEGFFIQNATPKTHYKIHNGREVMADADIPERAKRILQTNFSSSNRPTKTQLKIICEDTGAKYSHLEHFMKRLFVIGNYGSAIQRKKERMEGKDRSELRTLSQGLPMSTMTNEEVEFVVTKIEADDYEDCRQLLQIEEIMDTEMECTDEENNICKTEIIDIND